MAMSAAKRRMMKRIGKRGGVARAKKLSAARRSAIAKKGGEARAARYRELKRAYDAQERSEK